MCGGGQNPSGTLNTIQDLAAQQQANQNLAFKAGLPVEEATAAGGLPFMSQLTDYSGGTTAKAFAPGKAQLARQLAQAGIQPSDPRYIAAMSQFNEGEGKAFDSNMIQNLMANFAAKQTAGKDLLQFGTAENPLQALSVLLQGQLNA